MGSAPPPQIYNILNHGRRVRRNRNVVAWLQVLYFPYVAVYPSETQSVYFGDNQ